MSYDIKLFWKKDEKGVNVTVTTGEEDEDIVLDLKSKLNGFSYKKGFVEKSKTCGEILRRRTATGYFVSTALFLSDGSPPDGSPPEASPPDSGSLDGSLDGSLGDSLDGFLDGSVDGSVDGSPLSSTSYSAIRR
ncbi:unnamed protein product [Brassica oleracea]